MKFTEEEAYKELVAKMTNNGKAPLQASERTIKTMLKRYYGKFATEETELSDFVKDNIEDFKDFDGQARKDNADFVKKYQEEHPAKTEKPIDEKPKTELEKLMAEMAEIKQVIESSKKEKTIAQKKEELVSKMKELGVKNEDWAKTMVNKMSIREDTDVDTEANDFLQIYNKFQAGTKNDVTPENSHKTNNDSKMFDDIKASLQKKREQEEKQI
jgi:hypothetical protein